MVNLRILLLGTTRGGIARFLENLTRGLVHNGCKVELLLLDQYSSRFILHRSSDVKKLLCIKPSTKPLNMKTFVLKNFCLIKRLIKLDNFDIVHSNYAFSSFLSSLISALTHYETVYTIHGPPRPWVETSWRNKLAYAGEIILGRQAVKCTKCVTISQYANSLISQILHTQCHVIYHGIDTDFFKPSNKKENLRKNMGYSENEFVILFVGRLHPLKRPQLILHSLSRVTKSMKSINDKIRAVFIGTGELDSYLRKLASSLPYRCDFLTVEEEERLLRYYQASDVFIMPSVGESFGYAILEAMSCGLPIIASRSGAFPELLGNAGILFNPDDSEELAKLVELLRAESSLRIELSRKARERAVKFFDYRRMASEYISVYRSN